MTTLKDLKTDLNSCKGNKKKMKYYLPKKIKGGAFISGHDYDSSFDSSLTYEDLTDIDDSYLRQVSYEHTMELFYEM